MILMVAKGIRSGTCHFINRYVKTNNKYLITIKVENHHILSIGIYIICII